jgi:hypothetical protein
MGGRLLIEPLGRCLASGFVQGRTTPWARRSSSRSWTDSKSRVAEFPNAIFLPSDDRMVRRVDGFMTGEHARHPIDLIPPHPDWAIDERALWCDARVRESGFRTLRPLDEDRTRDERKTEDQRVQRALAPRPTAAGSGKDQELRDDPQGGSPRTPRDKRIPSRTGPAALPREFR